MAIVLQLHAIWRWVVLVVAALAAAKALIGWVGRQGYGRPDNLLGMILTISLDVQFLLGLLLWIWGPINLGLLARGAMSNAGTRFILLEHPLLILVALVLAHIGRARVRKATGDRARHGAALIFFGVSFLLVALVFLMQ